MGGVCGLSNMLVHIWVMYHMVMDKLHHVFPDGVVPELLRVCQQDVFTVRHLGRCPADRVQMEVRCCIHPAFRVLG